MSFEDFEAFRRRPERWLPVAQDLARRHGGSGTGLVPFEQGSNLVVALDQARVLKIFPPMLRHQFESERRALAALSGRLSVATPELLAEGARDDWPYLIMGRLSGRSGDQVWPELAEPNREALLRELGALIREVQGLPLGALADLEPRWPTFLKAQRAGCRARHERLGLSPGLLVGLEDYLDQALAELPPHQPEVILTGEYIAENLMLSEGPEGWRLSGLFDFGDMMCGFREYDLLGPSVFLAVGAPRRLRALLDGFDPTLAADPNLPRRLTALLLMHRFSDLERQIQVRSWQERVGSLAELEALLWPRS